MLKTLSSSVAYAIIEDKELSKIKQTSCTKGLRKPQGIADLASPLNVKDLCPIIQVGPDPEGHRWGHDISGHRWSQKRVFYEY